MQQNIIFIGKNWQNSLEKIKIPEKLEIIFIILVSKGEKKIAYVIYFFLTFQIRIIISSISSMMGNLNVLEKILKRWSRNSCNYILPKQNILIGTVFWLVHDQIISRKESTTLNIKIVLVFLNAKVSMTI